MVSNVEWLMGGGMLIFLHSDLALQLKPEEMTFIQAELKTLTALRRTTETERLKKCMLSAIWKDTSDGLSESQTVSGDTT